MMMRLAALTVLLSCFVVACGGDDAEGETNAEEETGPKIDPCGTEWVEKDASTPSIMGEFGAPCTTAADCVPILGDQAQCITNILNVYDLPGGFCTLPCDLPDSSTSFLHDSPECAAEGGVTCVGAQGVFTACIKPCTSDDECGREGYGCRQMPTLAAEGDPSFCLMNVYDCCSTNISQCGP